jgi:hypothetical protein
MIKDRTRPATDERGHAVSVLMLGVIAALIMVAGLVVDGGQKATAVSRAESVAAGAARAAANAGAGGTLAGGSGPTVAAGRARQAAQTYLKAAATGDGAPLSGTVTVSGPTVRVRTTVQVSTIFLSVIGIDHLSGDGEATARVVPT